MTSCCSSSTRHGSVCGGPKTNGQRHGTESDNVAWSNKRHMESQKLPQHAPRIHEGKKKTNARAQSIQMWNRCERRSAGSPCALARHFAHRFGRIWPRWEHAVLLTFDWPNSDFRQCCACQEHAPLAEPHCLSCERQDVNILLRRNARRTRKSAEISKLRL